MLSQGSFAGKCPQKLTMPYAAYLCWEIMQLFIYVRPLKSGEWYIIHVCSYFLLNKLPTSYKRLGIALDFLIISEIIVGFLAKERII